MISYITYKEAAFDSRAAFEGAKREAEAAGWLVSSLQPQGKRLWAIFGFESDEAAFVSVRPELPVFHGDRQPRRLPAAGRLLSAFRGRIGHFPARPRHRAVHGR